ncbi:MAG TPA: DNA recombination protein RmuC [Candidatus Paceibacterota bacterium]|nr:DNA recombination protein RmuC [Candidatus Paceibacterota bacterium]
MSTTAIVLLFLGLLFLLSQGFLLWWLSRKFGERSEAKADDTGFKLLLQQVNELSRTMDQKLTESSRAMNESVRAQFSESARLIKDVTVGLTKLDETNKQVVSFADQLQSLQDILKNPKQRGVLGEYYLETLLKNVLPPESFQMQYSFPDGTIVDAAVFVKDKIIPVDSKFSLENYNRIIEAKDPSERERLEKVFVNDLKMRIQETSKYIQPKEGTMDFAFMFIPHEAIYYDLLVNKIGAITEDTENLIQRAASKFRVIIVSPTSFLAYLQTVLQGLKALQIEESVKGIVKNVGELGKHLKTYEEYHGKLGNALGTAVNQYNLSGKEFKKIDKDIMRISGEGLGVGAVLIEAPEKAEN